MKVICDDDGAILGASILGELLGELQFRRTLGQPVARLNEAIHLYPSYSDVLSALAPRTPIADVALTAAALTTA